MSYNAESAEMLALQALTWLAANDDLMLVFMDATGAAQDDLKGQAADPAFLGAVLDFIMMDDAWVMAFCDASSLPYDRLIMARAVLPGGQQVNWT